MVTFTLRTKGNGIPFAIIQSPGIVRKRSKTYRAVQCSELAKLDHASQSEARKLFTLFRTWLRRQFEQLGHKANADELAMHLLARSQGVATLASAFHDERFIKQEVSQLYEWLSLNAKERAVAE